MRVHDSFGWKDFWTLVVQAATALGAAFLGASFGGRTAREAAVHAINEEWNRERRVALDRLLKRVETNLQRIERLAAKCAEHDPLGRFDPDVGEELEIVWNLYHRTSETIFLLGNDELSERIETFFVDAHSLAEKVKALEARAREIELADLQDTHRAGFAQRAKATSITERDEVKKEIAALGARATILLAEVRAHKLPTSAAPVAPTHRRAQVFGAVARFFERLAR